MFLHSAGSDDDALKVWSAISLASVYFLTLERKSQV